MENKVLFARVKKLVATERRIGIEILECLYEIEKRKAYAELKYDGLYTYCVKELKLTDSQAWQRIQAMYALKEIPELKPMMMTGSLNVSTVIQAYVRKEQKDGAQFERADKLDLYESIKNKTCKEVAHKISELKGEKLKIRLFLELDEEGEQLWKRAKGLLAHQSKGDDAETFKMVFKSWLAKNDPMLKSEKVKPPSSKTNPSSPTKEDVKQAGHAEKQRTEPLLTKVESEKRYVPTKLNKTIWKRDQGKCSHCKSTYALQIDHIKPFALGGETTEGNLRLLCRSCNLHFAVKEFGTKATHRMQS
jgi:hypothetical protein